ncbi:MAG: prepilin-type N-terminal cleavage/methylation domain-containing protein, partial [Halanaerobiales bacterium]|nr:prepilin-type N-terminal cleavage/methylation domain-containing protein [Halanaerobiales bacterium]
MLIDNNSGYTLVEIVLAIAILGLVFVPVLGFLTNSSGIITYAD